jgi:hypothetical protein
LSEFNASIREVLEVFNSIEQWRWVGEASSTHRDELFLRQTNVGKKRVKRVVECRRIQRGFSSTERVAEGASI